MVLHPDKKCRSSQAEFLTQCLGDQRRLRELLFFYGNSAYIYHQQSKEFEPTVNDYEEWLEGLKERALSIKGKRMRRKRSSTVKPVWRTLMNFTAMRSINTRGLAVANKCLILTAAGYNLKKWMKYVVKNSNANLQALSKEAAKAQNIVLNTLLHLITSCFRLSKITTAF